MEEILLTENHIPIGTENNQFKGIYNGDNKSITISSISSDFNMESIGIFGFVNGGTIQNLVCKGSLTSDTKTVGAIVGTIINGKIDNCHNYVSIITTNNYVGGICGIAKASNITNCSNNEIIKGKTSVAGICAVLTNSNITNCINNSLVSGNDNGEIMNYYLNEIFCNADVCIVGGIAAKVSEGSVINNCINSGIITGKNGVINSIGGIAG